MEVTAFWLLTCFVGDHVGLGHRFLITQIDRGSPLEQKRNQELEWGLNSNGYYSDITHEVTCNYAYDQIIKRPNNGNMIFCLIHPTKHCFEKNRHEIRPQQ